MRGLEQDRTDGTVYVAAGDLTTSLFSLRSTAETLSEPPVAVAWRRSRDLTVRREVCLATEDPLPELALAVEETGPITVRVGARS